MSFNLILASVKLSLIKLHRTLVNKSGQNCKICAKTLVFQIMIESPVFFEETDFVENSFGILRDHQPEELGRPAPPTLERAY